MLEIKSLSVVIDSHKILQEINLSFGASKIVGVVGPNGSGKSTFIKSCVGLNKPSSGEVRLFGGPLNKATQKKISYLPQRESIDWDFPLSVIDVVLMGSYQRLGIFRSPNSEEKARALLCLKEVGLEGLENRHISQLSGGQQQRVFIARALMTDAELFFMDEPFSAVDALSEELIMKVIHRLKDQGKSILMAHHDLGSVAQHTDLCLLINSKQIAFGESKKVLNSENLQEAYGAPFKKLAALLS